MQMFPFPEVSCIHLVLYNIYSSFRYIHTQLEVFPLPYRHFTFMCIYVHLPTLHVHSMYLARIWCSDVIQILRQVLDWHLRYLIFIRGVCWLYVCPTNCIPWPV